MGDVFYGFPSLDKRKDERSRRGREYILRVDGGPDGDGTVLDCTCPDYTYRARACKHMRIGPSHPQARLLDPTSAADREQITYAKLVIETAQRLAREAAEARAASQ